MADLGFWSIAQENPASTALVEPDGTEISAGDLLASANQLVYGLRELGLQPGDSVAMVLPNGAPVFELYLAALQAGWYLVPINHHLVGPEIAYIVSDSEAKAFIGDARFAEVCQAAAEELNFPREGRFAVSGDTRFKTPKSIDFIDEMPRDPNGKLYKRKLRDPDWAGRERAI